MLQRIIPSSGEKLPVIGLGTWKCFDTNDTGRYPQLSSVLENMYEQGGALIDSSPMYGKAEQVIGGLTHDMKERNKFFYATKVWTTGREEGIAQMESSMEKMQREKIDLMQIHNLLDWRTHLKVLREWKASGKIRYIGITHYKDEMHEELEKIMKEEPLDFVQFNYSIDAVHAEKRLLQAAADQGVATLINRPFGEGKLFQKVQGKPLPAWAIEAGMESWSSFCLRYILSHPAVTCVIPATSNPQHAIGNCKAAQDELPDEQIRAKMLSYFRNV